MTTGYDPVADFLHYQHAHTKKDSAKNLRNYASSELKLAEIEERFYELRCQYEPIGSSLEKIGFENKHVEKLVKEEIIHFCRYMLTGRIDRVVGRQAKQEKEE